MSKQDWPQEEPPNQYGSVMAIIQAPATGQAIHQLGFVLLKELQFVIFTT